MSKIQLRQELWAVNYTPLTRKMIVEAQLFKERVLQAKLFNVRKMMKWIYADIDNEPNHPFRELDTVFNFNNKIITGIHRQVFRWMSLLQSRDVTVYFDEVEHVGLRSVRFLKREGEIECGKSVRSRVGSRSRQIYGQGVRWSTLENVYFGGGPSLINHACSEHANVMIDYTDGTVLALVDISPGEALRANYEEDVDILYNTRGVRCCMCQ